MDALPPDPYALTTPEQLAAAYAAPSALVLSKATHRIGPATAAFIAASPFCILATSGARGIHATPRGDAPGFVTVLDETTLALPDRRGNNRLDALRDILEDDRVSLLFFVPGAGETLRVHGHARITADPALCARFTERGKDPATVLLLRVAELFLQCPKAVIRSGLWQGLARPEALPSMGALLAEHTSGRVEPAGFDAAAPARLAATLY